MAGLVGKTSQYWSGFDPRSIGGCTLWLNETSVVQSGANVTDWLDKSGRGNNLTTDISFGYPSVASNYFNNLNMVRFNSNYMFSQFASNIYPGEGYVVVAVDISGAINNVISIAATDTSNCIGLTLSNGRWLMDASSGAFTGVTSLSNDTTCNVPTLLQYTPVDSNFRIRRCGRQLINQNTTIWRNNSNTTSFQVGARQRRLNGQVQSNCLKGYVGEVIFYNVQLSAQNRQAVEGYLSYKWGLLQRNVDQFSPLSISGCRLWLDGRDTCGNGLITNLATPTLNYWADKSGNKYDASQSGSSTFYPIILSNDGGTQYNTNRHFLLPNGALPSGDTSYSYFVAVQHVNNATGSPYIYGQGFAFGQIVSTNNASAVEWSGGSGFFVGYSNMYTANVRCIAETHYTSSLGARSIGVDEVSLSRIPSAIRTQGTISNAIARNLFTTSNFAGNIYEIIVYNKQVTPPERRQIINYLAYKWNIPGINVRTLPYGHVYNFNNPVSRIFSPTDISTNCIFWLDAAERNKVELNSVSRVSNWIDKSAPGYNFTNTLTTGNYGPGRSNALNGMDVLSFNGVSGSSGNTLSNALATLLQSNHSLIAMTKPTVVNSNSWGNTSLFRNEPSGGYVVFPYMQGLVSRGYITSAVAAISAASSLLVTNSIANSNEIIIANIRSIRQQVFRNGILQASCNVSIGSGLQPAGNFYLGSSNGNTQFYAGDVAELLVYSSALDSNQLEQVEGYLAWKWGRQSDLPSSHPFSKIKPLLPSFLPTSLEVPIAWFSTEKRSSFLFQRDSNTVGTWLGLTSNGTSNPTTLTANRGTGNVNLSNIILQRTGGPKSQSVLYIDPSSALQTTPTTSIILPAAMSFFAVVKSSNLPADTQWFNLRHVDVAGAGSLIRNYSAEKTTGLVYSYNDSGDSTSRFIYDNSTNFMTSNTWYITSIINSNASTNLSTDVYWALNGQRRTLSNISTGTVMASFRGAGTLNINQTAINSSTYAEFMFFNRAIAFNQAKQIEGYLAWKWGLQSNLPADHPFRGASP